MYRKFHISMFLFLIFYLPSKEQDHIFQKRNIFPDNAKNIIFPCNFFAKTIFSEHLQKIVLPNNMITFSGKRNIFPDNTKKVIFQCNFFGKTTFSEHLKNKVWFSVQCMASQCENDWIISSRSSPAFFYPANISTSDQR